MSLEWNSIKRFSQHDTPCFSFDDAKQEFKAGSPSYLAQILSKRVSKKLFIKRTWKFWTIFKSYG